MASRVHGGRRVASRALLRASGLLAFLAACSTSTTSAPPSTPDPRDDAGATEGGAGTDAGGLDAGEGGAPTACEGACKATSVVADFGGKQRTLVRAQFGTQAGDAGTELHTESHLGGAAPCPTQQSPTPEYTLIVSAIPKVAPGAKLSDNDGVTGAFFDFKGDLGLPPLTKAVSVNLTNVIIDSATPPAWVAFDVKAGFREGNVDGHVYATFCSSLSE